MARSTTISLLLLAASLMGAGCGGHHSNSSDSAFAGSYGGTFQPTAGGDSGTLTFTVGNDGRLTGSTTDPRYGSGTIVTSGSRIGDDGSTRILSTFLVNGSTVTTSASGTLTRQLPGLEGTLTNTPSDGSAAASYTYTLSPAVN